MGALDDLPLLTRHRPTVADYYRMAEAGVLGPQARVELIEGEVIDMAPIGSRHHAAVLRLSRRLQFAVGDHALVSVRDGGLDRRPARALRPLLPASGRRPILACHID